MLANGVYCETQGGVAKMEWWREWKNSYDETLTIWGMRNTRAQVTMCNFCKKRINETKRVTK
jgi:hypothetical protein